MVKELNRRGRESNFMSSAVIFLAIFPSSHWTKVRYIKSLLTISVTNKIGLDEPDGFSPGKFFRGKHGRLRGEDFFGQNSMHLFIAIEARVLDHEAFVIQVTGHSKRR